MTTATAPAPTSTASRVTALAVSELRLISRNRTVLVSSAILPLAMGVFFAYAFKANDLGVTGAAMAVAAQIAVVLAMGIYVTATQTLVARRHSRVLKRLRITGLTDRDLLVAVVLPTVVIGLGQLAIFLVFNLVSGTPWPVNVASMVIAVVGGIVLVVAAALATSVITPSPERAQITTLPLTFLLLGGAIVTAITALSGWWELLSLLPGAAVGSFVRFAMAGGIADQGLAGLPAFVIPAVSLIGWSIAFLVLAARKFRWDPRH
ncbi:ABC transporter permease [Pseudonocardia sp. GCM10023141]|uniref:ABC transporter permease n=1 Tax=Pseudonocardia sp. GCM10023141 TaxID=3252653 RepID=UPI00360DA616